MRYAVIMAGGSGTRLWPMSTRATPKQLIPFIEGRSLLDEAVRRLDGLIDPARRLICTGESLRGPIRRSLPEIADAQILGEPQGRDTLAAVGLSAAVLAKKDPDAVIATFTADHLIDPIDTFQACVETGLRLVEREPNTLVTFGIEPTHAATGYGYVRLGPPLAGSDGVFRTAEFKEKPDEATAARYLASGDYRWNSGMFVWRAATLLGRIRRYKPAVHAGLMEIAAAWDSPTRLETLARVYPTLEKTSVDYAVMERAVADGQVAVATVSMPVDWRDIGGWPAYAQTLTPDEAGNRSNGSEAIHLDSRNILTVSEDPHHLIATVGLEDVVIVHTARATLVCKRDQAERIKTLHDQIARRFGGEYL